MKKYIGIILAVIVVGIVAWAVYAKLYKSSQEPISAVSVGVAKYANAKGETWTIPKGEFQFNISSAEKYPKMVTGIISPLDVKVGDIQTMMIAINGDAPMARVWAEVETDNSTKIIELVLSATSTVSMIDRLKEPYFVDEKGFLVVNDGKNNDIAKKLVNTAEATAGVTQYRYEGEWKVEDTHTKTYHTKFIAEDTVGRRDSTILAWSDPNCEFDINGNLTTLSCIPAAGEVIGFDGGVVTIPSNGTVTLTGTGSVFAFNGGTNGSIQIVPGGKIGTAANPITPAAPIQQAFMWYVDADNDLYTPNVQAYATTSATWTGHVRVKDVAGKNTGTSYQVPETTSLDCYDSGTNASSTYPGQTNYFSAARGDGSYDYDCNNVIWDQFAASGADFPPIQGIPVCDLQQTCGQFLSNAAGMYDCSSGSCVSYDFTNWDYFNWLNSPTVCWKNINQGSTPTINSFPACGVSGQYYGLNSFDEYNTTSGCVQVVLPAETFTRKCK